MTLPAVRKNKLYHVSANSNRTPCGFAQNGWKSQVPAAGRVMTLPYGAILEISVAFFETHAYNIGKSP